MKISAIVTRLLRVESLVAYLLANLGFLRYVSVVSVEDDYLICNPIDATGVIDTATEKKIAKPYLLRRTPFDGKTRDGITYIYTTGAARIADDGSILEGQVIVQSYVAGDIILVRRVSPYTMVTAFDESAVEFKLTLIDINNDARAWAAIE